METQKMPPKSAVGSGVQLMPDDRLLRAIEVQRELCVSRATAYRLMTDGSLPVYRFGGRRGQRAMVRVSAKDLKRWLEEHRKDPANAA
jgi:excisionase family DNA binding protein